jgi:hypothetical protein
MLATLTLSKDLFGYFQYIIKYGLFFEWREIYFEVNTNLLQSILEL